MQDFRGLTVWRKAHALALDVHYVTRPLEHSDRSGVVSQMRRAALSIPANIAEGSARLTDKDFAKFIQIAIASATELDYHLEFASDAGVLAKEEIDPRRRNVVEVRRMLFGLLKRLRAVEESRT